MKVQSVMTMTAVAVLMAGCASDRMERAQDQAEINKFRQAVQAEREARSNERVESEIEKYPDWAMEEGPVADPQGVSAVGIAEGANPSMALRKARLKAEFGLASGYNQAISGGERLRESEQGDRVSQDYELLIERLVDDVPVVGHETRKQEVRAIAGKPTAFVELYLPYEQYNEALRERKNEARDARTEEAFQDLQQRLEDYRERKAGGTAAPVSQEVSDGGGENKG